MRRRDPQGHRCHGLLARHRHVPRQLCPKVVQDLRHLRQRRRRGGVIGVLFC
ncbi:hypothetical protein STTU_2928 [Streptomyces sp. Tu6071]|nr:hypothetical protein STTU_2928 [Streptomyces sp. Tu6071]